MESSRKKVGGFKLIVGYLGIFLMLIGVLVLMPLISFIFFPSEAKDNYIAFLLPGSIYIFVGFLLSLLIYKKETDRLKNHEDIVLVFLIWVMSLLCGCVPYLFLFDYNFVDALFEITSGFTTSGFSMIKDYTTVPNVFYFYRSVNLFFGGLGLVLILNSAISDRHSMRLYTSDGHNDKLLPNVLKSARLILGIYTLYVIIGSISLYIAGLNCHMTFFEAFNNSISCLSGGGFGMHLDSIGYYNQFGNSIGVEIVCCVLMVLAATNFFTHLFLLSGKFKNVYHHCETKLIILYLIIILPISGLLVYYFNDYTPTTIASSISLSNSYRVSVFSFISAFSTTGLSNTSIIGISNFSPMGGSFFAILMVGMLFGGCAGSTSGGMKLNRVAYLTKSAYYNLSDSLYNKRKYRPHYIEKFGKRYLLESEEYQGVVSFSLLYLLFFFIGVLLFSIDGANLGDALFDSAGSLSTVGLTNGNINPYASQLTKLTCIILMFLGRIEILPFLVSLSVLRKKVFKKGY